MNMNWFALVLGGLVTYRLALLVSKESGPAFVFRKLRRLPEAKTSLKEGLACVWCQAVWMAGPVTVYEWWLGWVPVQQMPLYWLGMSSLAIFANQQWTKG